MRIADAWDQLQGRDPDAAELKFQMDRQEREDQISAELEQLKAQISSGDE